MKDPQSVIDMLQRSAMSSRSDGGESLTPGLEIASHECSRRDATRRREDKRTRKWSGWRVGKSQGAEDLN